MNLHEYGEKSEDEGNSEDEGKSEDEENSEDEVCNIDGPFICKLLKTNGNYGDGLKVKEETNEEFKEKENPYEHKNPKVIIDKDHFGTTRQDGLIITGDYENIKVDHVPKKQSYLQTTNLMNIELY